MDLLVREAREEDLDALLALYEELADRPSARGAGSEQSLLVLRGMLSDPDRHLLVAELDGAVVGTVDLLIAANLTHAAKPWGIVENVVVAERARRRGVARALMGRLFEIASSAGCYKVQLLSGNRREDAHAMYRALGMDAMATGFKIYFASAPEAQTSSPQTAFARAIDLERGLDGLA